VSSPSSPPIPTREVCCIEYGQRRDAYQGERKVDEESQEVVEVVGKEDGCGEGKASAGKEGVVSGWPSKLVILCCPRALSLRSYIDQFQTKNCNYGYYREFFKSLT